MADAEQEVPVDDAPPVPRHAVDDWGSPPPESEPPTEPARPGPEQIDADSWEDIPPAAVIEYEGRRRATDSPSRRGLIVALVVAALIAVVSLPFILSGSDDVATPPGPVSAPGVASSAGFTPSATAGGAVPLATGSTAPRTTTTRPAPRTTTTTTQPAPPPPPPFAALTLEAETRPRATLSGSAHDEPYAGASGGRIAFNVGNWGMDGGPGSVTFNDIVIPSTGTYVVTIFSVHPDGDANRAATITVSGVAPSTLPFVGSAACCQTKAVSFVIPAGTHTITIGNPSGRAPAIDKITIGRP